MSNENNPNNVQEDEFKAFATHSAEEEANRKNRGGGIPYELEVIKWTGFEKAGGSERHVKILRALGGVPNTNKTAFDARTVRIAQIICDDKKTRRYVLPSYDENKAHVIWRLINNVLAITYEDKKKVIINETAHPEIYQTVKNNNFPIGSLQQKTTHGWSGRDMFIMNCIDREQIAWHKENKHSMLLSKEIRKWAAPDGKILDFPEQGVPSFGFVQLIASEVFAFYGDWKNYDIGIERTGTLNTPYKIFNCDKNPEKLPEKVKGFVTSGPLTDEEKSWEMYDLRKLFGVSSYTKWWNNLKNNIATIDAALGTHYYTELKSLMETEKKEREEQRKAGAIIESESEGTEEEPTQEATTVPIPLTEVRTTPISTTGQTHCVDKLPPNLKEQIESYGFDTKGKFIIKYKTKESTVGCSVCHTPAPKSWTACPFCGISF